LPRLRGDAVGGPQGDAQDKEGGDQAWAIGATFYGDPRRFRAGGPAGRSRRNQPHQSTCW
jgi:hypothetical protein